MSAEVTAGWIGLLGASVGAGAALLGGWLQQKHQVKATREQRREERRYANGQAALELVIRLRHANMRRTEEVESIVIFTEALVEFATAFEAALYVVSDGEEMRKRTLYTMGFVSYSAELGHTHGEAKRWIDAMCAEAIRVLSAFLRGEPLPEPTTAFLDRREIVRAHIRTRSAPP